MSMSNEGADEIGFTLINSEVKSLTKEMAEEFRNLPASPTERELNESRVKHLREKADAGLLIPFQWSVAELDGKKVRMNGQHSSNMLCALNGNFPAGLKVHLDTYKVKTAEGLAHLFRQFDDRKSGRTPTDVAGAYQGINETLKDVAKPTAKIAAEGICWYDQYIEGMPAVKGDDQYSLFNDRRHDPFIQWLGELFSIKTPELRKIPIVAAIYGTFMRNEAEARKFWAAVARGGDEFSETDPATVLDAWLKAAAETRSNRKELKPANYYQASVFAWNAHRDSKTISTVKFDARKSLYKISE